MSSFKSPRSLSARKARASPVTSRCQAVFWSTCRRFITPAFRAKSSPRKIVRGFVVRTAAGGATDDEIRTDIDFLGKTWNEIKERSEQRKAPALLHRDLDLVERMLRDYVSDDFTAIWID